MVVVPNLWVMLTGKPAEGADAAASAALDEAVLDVAALDEAALDEAAADAWPADDPVVPVALEVLDDPQAVSSAPTASAATPAAQWRDLMADSRSGRSEWRVSFVVTGGPSGQVDDPTGDAHDTDSRRAVGQVSLTYR